MSKRLLLLVPFLLSALSLHAQRVDVSAGGGINNLGQGWAHATFFTSVTARILPSLTLGGEYAWQDAGTIFLEDINFNPSTQDTDVQHLQNYGAVLRVGLPHRRPAQSYLLVAGGGLHVTDTFTLTNMPDFGPSFTPISTSTHNGAYIGAGAGASLPIRHGFGVRPEFRYEYQRLPPYEAGLPSSHVNQILFTISLYKGFGNR